MKKTILTSTILTLIILTLGTLRTRAINVQAIPSVGLELWVDRESRGGACSDSR